MSSKSRNPIIAKAINTIFRICWFITRPKTKGVKALVFNKGKILMVRLTYYPNTWTFPGGGVDKGEDPETAVIRECKEEVGIDIENPEFIKTLDFKHEYKKDTVYVYKVETYIDEIKIDGREVAEASWFDLKYLPNMGKNAKRILRECNTNNLSFLQKVAKRLKDSGMEVVVFGGWADELNGDIKPREHGDIDLLLFDQDFSGLERFMKNNSDIEEIEKKRSAHKRAFKLDGVMTELFLVQKDGEGKLFTDFWGEYKFYWPDMRYKNIEDVNVADRSVNQAYRKKDICQKKL